MCSICCKPWLLSLAIKFYGGREDFRVTDACALSARQGKSSLALRFCQGRFNPYHEDGMWNLTVSTPNRSNWSTFDIFWHIMSVVKELWVSSSIISIATLSCFCWVENSWSEEISRKNSRRLIAFPVFFSELNILPPVDRLPLVLPSCSRLCDYATWLSFTCWKKHELCRGNRLCLCRRWWPAEASCLGHRWTGQRGIEANKPPSAYLGNP